MFIFFRSFTEIADGMQALCRAKQIGALNCHTFDNDICISTHARGMYWVVPDKILIFDSSWTLRKNFDYIKRNFVSTIIWFRPRESASMDSKQIIGGITHLTWYGNSLPNEHTIKRFLATVETSRNSVGIWCDSDLSHCTVLTTLYVMRAWKLTAAQAAMWYRICVGVDTTHAEQTWLEKHDDAPYTRVRVKYMHGLYARRSYRRTRR